MLATKTALSSGVAAGNGLICGSREKVGVAEGHGIPGARARGEVMSVIWNKPLLQLPNRFFSRPSVFRWCSMSYNPYKKRGGGPNRGGGRGRGRGRGGRGRGSGPPPGLSGKEIGMYYRKKTLAKKDEREKNEVQTMLLYVYECVL